MAEPEKPRPKPRLPLAPFRPTDSEPVPKVLHDLVTVVHKLRDAGLNHEEIMAALKAHKAKRDSGEGEHPAADGLTADDKTHETSTEANVAAGAVPAAQESAGDPAAAPAMGHEAHARIISPLRPLTAARDNLQFGRLPDAIVDHVGMIDRCPM